MNNLDKNIEIALNAGLFSQPENETANENIIFDTYGNYYFPTDFSSNEKNSILSVSQVTIPAVSK